MSDYRARLYQSYGHADQFPTAPAHIEDEPKQRVALLKKLIQDHFPRNHEAAILDLGCGYGALVYFARQAGYQHLIGVDRSPEQIAAGQRLGIAGLRQGDLRKTLATTATESQDVVVSFDVIEHFRKEEILDFVDEVKRVLKANGKWIIHTPNAESPFGTRTIFGDFTHEVAFTRESLRQVLLASGFRQVQCFEDAPIPLGLKSTLRWLVWKCIRAGLQLYVAAETGIHRQDPILSQNFLAVAVR